MVFLLFLLFGFGYFIYLLSLLTLKRTKMQSLDLSSGPAAESQKDQDWGIRWFNIVLFRAVLPITFLIFLYYNSAERRTALTISEDNPPQFSMSGSGELARLMVRGPKVRDAAGEAQYIVWQIELQACCGESVEWLSPISYGRVPAGYKQIYPEIGSAPPIIDGEVYFDRSMTEPDPNSHREREHQIVIRPFTPGDECIRR